MTHKRNSNSKMKANNVTNTNIISSKLAQIKEVREQKTSSLSSELEGKINSITQGYRPYIRKKLIDMATTTNLENANIICNYIVTEQNEINIKESTREGKIKILLSLDNYFHSTKSFTHMTKHDISNYLNSLKKPDSIDPNHKSIGTYNGRQMILSKFFRWLYNPDEPDQKKRITPPCMIGIKRLPRKEQSPYKPSDLWTNEEHAIFLKYCPLIRDRAYHAIANDTSARPSEILNLKIKDIIFKTTEDRIQYAEISVSSKTKPRTLPLIDSIPYINEWIQNHPTGSNNNSWLFVTLSTTNFGEKLSRDSLLKQYQEQYRDHYFPKLVKDTAIPQSDKAYIKNMLTKPWNLYVIRHAALTAKSQILKEHTLRDHAGWSLTSKMPQVYIHYFGTESSNSLLQAHGIITKDNQQRFSHILKPKRCPNCYEPNKPDSRFCSRCRMILTYDAYKDTLETQQEKEQVLALRKELEPLLVLKKTLEDQGILKVS